MLCTGGRGGGGLDLGDLIEDRSAVSAAANVIDLKLKEQIDALLNAWGWISRRASR